MACIDKKLFTYQDFAKNAIADVSDGMFEYSLEELLSDEVVSRVVRPDYEYDLQHFRLRMSPLSFKMSPTRAGGSGKIPCSIVSSKETTAGKTMGATVHIPMPGHLLSLQAVQAR